MDKGCLSDDVLLLYLHAELPAPAAVAVVERHLAICSGCAQRRDHFVFISKIVVRSHQRKRAIPRELPADILRPTVPEPTTEQLTTWLAGTTCQATDGCEVETDGTCQHGHPSWLVYLKLREAGIE